MQIICHALGAVFAATAPAVPSWQLGFNNGENIGGLISAILAPAGGFGKCLVVLLALSVPSACAPTMYIFGLSFTSASLTGVERLRQAQALCQSLPFLLESPDMSSS